MPYKLAELRKSRSMLFGLGLANKKISIRRSGIHSEEEEDLDDTLSLVSL